MNALKRTDPHPRSTLDEERREVFDSVIESLQIAEFDPDRLAACACLVCHLARNQPFGV